jgi:hypothetical protein
MDEACTRLRRDYTPAFLAYLTHRDESGLRSAYELGRAAVSNRVRLLEMVRIHEETLHSVVSTAKTVEEAQDLVRAAAAFIAEALAPFEMALRDFTSSSDLATRTAPRHV